VLASARAHEACYTARRPLRNLTPRRHRAGRQAATSKLWRGARTRAYHEHDQPRPGGATTTDEAHDTRDSEAGTTVAEAARQLGISEGAVRKRVERGKLRAEHDAAGRLIVYLEGGAGDTTDTTRDRPRQSRDDRYTISLEDQVAYLRGQLDQERTASAELRRIVAGLTQRIPEIEAAPAQAKPEPRESPERPGPGPTPTEASAAQETPTQRRPWWRRVFGP
jgi:transposase-like protein